ncbi:MAG: phosphoribosylglycinamide formyltransferase [Vallitaleaceae bacterium]|nr:phosphoribosylglycinamide formyltransferase [Vallitaleaceae bacterium]
MPRIAVFVSGGGTNLQAIIDAVEAGRVRNTEIVAVVSNRKNAYALERARIHHIEAKCIRRKDYMSEDDFCDAMISYLEELKVELVVLAGYLVILNERFIRRFRNRIINVHPSLIPSFAGDGFYGLKVHEEALKRGVKISGATVHVVDEITDHGPILYQKAVDVRENDTAEMLQRRIMEEAEWVLLPKAIDEFHTWFPKLK